MDIYIPVSQISVKNNGMLRISAVMTWLTVSENITNFCLLMRLIQPKIKTKKLFANVEMMKEGRGFME